MRKLLILLTAFLFTIQISKAQTDKGDQSLGINLGASYNDQKSFVNDPFNNSSSNQETKITSFDIGPNYSYFIADKLDVGTSLYYSYYKDKYNYGDNSASPTNESGKTYKATIFIRKYLMYNDKLGMRVGPYLSYEYANQTINYNALNAANNLNSTINSYGGGINLELIYYASKYLGFSASLANVNYYHSKSNNGDQGNGSGNQVNFDYIDNGLNFSIFYTFGNK